MSAEALSRIIVVGGSLAGLNVAAWLHEAGYQVEVFERSARPLEDRGTGLVLNPATVRFFDTHDVVDVSQISAPARRYRYVRPDGSTSSEGPCSFRFTAYNVLYRSLLQCIDQRQYHLGEECVGFQQEGREVIVHFASGRVEQCDLLIFADGVNSFGRKVLVPEAQVQYAGYVAWRGNVGEDVLSSETYAALHESVTYGLMEDSHALAYPIPNRDGSVAVGHRLTNWLWYWNVPAGQELDRLLTGRNGKRFTTSVPPNAIAPEQLARLRTEGQQLAPEFAEMIDKTPELFLQLQVIVDVGVPQMAFGRVCLIGDAAFTVRPHIAAGTAKAAEDGRQLVESLRRHDGAVEDALAEWSARQVALGQAATRRTQAVGYRLQHGQWTAHEPVPYGLYSIGDSTFPDHLPVQATNR